MSVQPLSVSAFYLDGCDRGSRWLLGRTWGDSTHQLRLEHALYQTHHAALARLGHDLTVVEDNNELMGHAGAIAMDHAGHILRHNRSA
ncbi:hypothetical protein P4S72_22330 [Vibrio sp. PP-XX7]